MAHVRLDGVAMVWVFRKYFTGSWIVFFSHTVSYCQILTYCFTDQWSLITLYFDCIGLLGQRTALLAGFFVVKSDWQMKYERGADGDRHVPLCHTATVCQPRHVLQSTSLVGTFTSNGNEERQAGVIACKALMGKVNRRWQRVERYKLGRDQYNIYFMVITPHLMQMSNIIL